jgi:hypothetical protein
VRAFVAAVSKSHPIRLSSVREEARF